MVLGQLLVLTFKEGKSEYWFISVSALTVSQPSVEGDQYYDLASEMEPAFLVFAWPPPLLLLFYGPGDHR